MVYCMFVTAGYLQASLSSFSLLLVCSIHWRAVIKPLQRLHSMSFISDCILLISFIVTAPYDRVIVSRTKIFETGGIFF